MKVNKEIFYHAYSGEKVDIGGILVFNSDTHNKMYDEVYNNEYKIDGIDANELLINKKRNQEIKWYYKSRHVKKETVYFFYAKI